ncbi:hypothetical protein GCM10012320_12660 [Sinomonas cellulolyticus]|nr:hypothetical protein GCM10012320_12660 [Sinomonas sp. KCTC 49339]
MQKVHLHASGGGLNEGVREADAVFEREVDEGEAVRHPFPARALHGSYHSGSARLTQRRGRSAPANPVPKGAR